MIRTIHKTVIGDKVHSGQSRSPAVTVK